LAAAIGKAEKSTLHSGRSKAGNLSPIHLKETDALIHTIQAMKDKVQDKRLDASVDNQALIAGWQNSSSRDAVFQFSPQTGVSSSCHS
jgi:hypothetical protein